MRPHSAPTQGTSQQDSLLQGSLQQGSLQQGRSQQGSPHLSGLWRSRPQQVSPQQGPWLHSRLQQGPYQQGAVQHSQQPLSERDMMLGDELLELQQQVWPQVYNEDPWAMGGALFGAPLASQPAASAAEAAQSQPQSRVGAGAGAGAQGHFQGQALVCHACSCRSSECCVDHL